MPINYDDVKFYIATNAMVHYQCEEWGASIEGIKAVAFSPRSIEIAYIKLANYIIHDPRLMAQITKLITTKQQ